MCNVALLDGKHLAALLALGLVVPDPLNQDGSIQMLNLVGSDDIEMLFGTEKPYISSWHSDGTDYTSVSREHASDGGIRALQLGVRM